MPPEKVNTMYEKLGGKVCSCVLWEIRRGVFFPVYGDGKKEERKVLTFMPPGGRRFFWGVFLLWKNP